VNFFSLRPRPLPTVTFATCCWEKDWRPILLDPEYLRIKQIENHQFPFVQRVLIINNVADLNEVQKAAQKRVEEGVLTHVYVAEERVHAMLDFFQLKRGDFVPDVGISPDWIYYNALGPLTALYNCSSDYLLYMTGDSRLDYPICWIEKALRRMEKVAQYSVANLVWNENYTEAKRESYKTDGDFFVAKQGFSDQLFLVRTPEFRQPIYGEIRPDSGHYPRGDVWEKRAFSYLKNRDRKRIIYRHGSYRHENF
jgi:hypothetical protein